MCERIEFKSEEKWSPFVPKTIEILKIEIYEIKKNSGWNMQDIICNINSEMKNMFEAYSKSRWNRK